MTIHKLLTSRQMNEIDSLTIKGGITGSKLMENAGEATVNLIFKRYEKRPVSVLCGPGKNGGDGFVIARLLKDAGWTVRVGLSGKQSEYTAIKKAELWNYKIEHLSTNLLKDNPLVIDAIIGSGLKRDLDGTILEVITKINNTKLDCIAVDIPSGVDSNTGEILGEAPNCKLTVTFLSGKLGHYLLPAKKKVGELIICDIGIPKKLLQKINSKVSLNTPDLWKKKFPIPTCETHKYHRGHLLIAGTKNMVGATQLAALSARRVGAGLTTIAAPKETYATYQSGFPGNLTTLVNSCNEWKNQINDPKKTNILIGPGIENSNLSKDFVLAALNSKKSVVLDANGISIFKNKPSQLFCQTKKHHILTPHEGEFDRVFKYKGNSIKKVQKATKRSGAIIFLKGSTTIIAHPNGNVVINDTGTPYLATAGSGDVLSGIIAGLVSQGMPPFNASCAGAWIHGKTAEFFGPGLIAEDIQNQIPKVLEEIINYSNKDKNHYYW